MVKGAIQRVGGNCVRVQSGRQNASRALGRRRAARRGRVNRHGAGPTAFDGGPGAAQTAQTNLGLPYEYDRGFRLDHENAVQWYRRAADAGHARGTVSSESA